MMKFLSRGLHSRNGLVRKGTALLLQAPKRISRKLSGPDDYAANPPVLANSFPKSGTHLLDQIVEALPNRRNYGAFISSMTSSYQFRRLTTSECSQALQAVAPGEVVRAHVFFDEMVQQVLVERRFVHYFIYRDLRDVVLSEAHYYRSMNRWHRLHPVFRDAPSIADAVMLAIKGIDDPNGRIYFPDVGARFRHYEPWVRSPDVLSVRFEDLVSERRDGVVRSMSEFFLERCGSTGDGEQLARAAIANITPEKSHTFRKGKRGGWRDAFTDEHRAALKQVAGSILIEHGYEADENW